MRSKQERRAGRPGLRAARGRVLDRVLRHRPRVAAERLGQAAVEELGGVEDAGGDLRRLLLEAVAAQAPGDERVVERPDGADVVADRVVAALALGQRAHAPAGEEPWRPSGGARRPSPSTCRRCRSRADGRCSTSSESTWRPSASSASAKYSPSSTQKSRLKRRLRSAACFSSSSAKAGSFQTSARQAGAAHLGVVGVALQLAGRPREAGQRAVAVGDRVPGVLPALVLEAGLLVAALVGDVAVALQVGVLVDPVERGARLVLEVAHELRVAGPALVLVEQDDEQRRRVGGAVVRRVRPLLEGRHLAVAHLVQDAPGILVAEVVDPRALPHRRARAASSPPAPA